GKDNQYLQPSQSLENITLDMVLDAVRSAEETTHLQPDDVVTVEKVDDVLISIDKAIADASKDISLKDLI
ncbi:MAG: hypothetical protein KAT12_01235, partial [Gammaproteobacteria bacterium]|nr:hypothetical protein [Gammaproteobacteria bacterium]